MIPIDRVREHESCRMNFERERVIKASHHAKTRPEVAQQKKLDSAIQVLASYSVESLEPPVSLTHLKILLAVCSLLSVRNTSALRSQGQPHQAAAPTMRHTQLILCGYGTHMYLGVSISWSTTLD